MLRDVDMKEISDGQLYKNNDLVKAGCNDCKGCCDCCKGMGNSIVLDPYDVFRLTGHLNCSFESLIGDAFELGVVDGLVLPSLAMKGEEEACTFLNEEGRCSVHPYRPGICRLFPLGRIYDEEGFSYFLQTKECKKTTRTKVKVKKWLDTPNLEAYDAFILDWHRLVVSLREKVTALAMEDGSEDEMKAISMKLLQTFYLQGYRGEDDFFAQFKERLEKYHK